MNNEPLTAEQIEDLRAAVIDLRLAIHPYEMQRLCDLALKALRPEDDECSLALSQARQDLEAMAARLAVLEKSRLPEGRGWISVKERLPELSVEVLLYHCIGDVLRTETCTIDVAWMSRDGDLKPIWGFPWDRAEKNPKPRWAIAWMPMPEAPSSPQPPPVTEKP